MKKRLTIIGFIVSLILVLFPVSLSAAYDEYLNITVSSNNASAFTYMPVLVNINNSQLSDYGYIDSDGLNTNLLEGATARDFAVYTNKTLIVIPSLAAGQQRTYQYQLGYTPDQTAFPFSTGYNGYLTISDDASLEPGDNFELEIDGYFDTSVDGDIISKTSAFSLVTSGGNVTATYSYLNTTPSSITQSTAAGTQTVDDFAGQHIPDFWGEITSVQFNMRKVNTPTGTISANVYDYDTKALIGTVGTMNASSLTTSSAWYTFNTNPVDVSTEKDIVIGVYYTDGDVTHYIQAYYNGSSTIDGTFITSSDLSSWTVPSASWDCAIDLDYDAYSVGSITATATDVTAGEHIIKVTADTTDFKIYIDSIEKDSTALGGKSIVDNANDWVLFNDNVTPYVDYYKHTVSSVLKAWYQPNSMITPSSLTDRSGNGNTGVMTLVGNHPSITITLGGIVASSSYTASTDGEEEGGEVVYVPGIDGFENTSATGSDLPYYTIFARAADSMGTSTLAVYGMMILFIALIIFVAVSISTSSQMLGLAGAGIVLGVGAAAIIGIWVVFIVILGGGMLLYVYRRT